MVRYASWGRRASPGFLFDTLRNLKEKCFATVNRFFAANFTLIILGVGFHSVNVGAAIAAHARVIGRRVTALTCFHNACNRDAIVHDGVSFS